MEEPSGEAKVNVAAYGSGKEVGNRVYVAEDSIRMSLASSEEVCMGFILEKGAADV